MTESAKKNMLRTNTIYWIAAMLLPVLLHFGFKAFASESAKFPWPVILPLLVLGLMLGSNSLLSRALNQATGNPDDK